MPISIGLPHESLAGKKAGKSLEYHLRETLKRNKTLLALARTAYNAKNLAASLTIEKSEPLSRINRMYGLLSQLMMEGYMRPRQANFFTKLFASNPHIKNVAETGFNAGHSSYVFLSSRPDVRVTSFDLGEHPYVSKAKGYMDSSFPGRHTLVLGDSKSTIPDYARNETREPFDLVFVDGGHDQHTAYADIVNFRSLSNKGATIVLDDYIPESPSSSGPALAWKKAIEEGVIEQIGLVSGNMRTWVVGYYI